MAGGFPGPERRLAVARRPRSFIWARRRRLLLAWARRNGLYRPSLPAGTRTAAVVRLGPAGRPGRHPARRRVRSVSGGRFRVHAVGGGVSWAVPSRRLGREGAVGGRAAGAVDHERRAHRHGPGQRPGLRGARRWCRRRRPRDEGARLRLAHRADAVGRHPDRVPGGRVDRLGPRLARGS